MTKKLILFLILCFLSSATTHSLEWPQLQPRIKRKARNLRTRQKTAGMVSNRKTINTHRILQPVKLRFLNLLFKYSTTTTEHSKRYRERERVVSGAFVHQLFNNFKRSVLFLFYWLKPACKLSGEMVGRNEWRRRLNTEVAMVQMCANIFFRRTNLH